MKNDILNQLNRDNLYFENCSSQCYDNANAMSGDKGGLQRLMRNKNPLELFNNCNKNSLNLVGLMR